MRVLTLLVMIPGLFSCGGAQGPSSSSFAVTFTTESDLGLPLEGVIVSANNAGVGASDEDGVVQTMLRGPDGAAVQITYECPEGHRQPESAKVLRLHRFQSLDPTAQAGLHMLLTCPPIQRTVAFVVRTGQAEVPVLLNNEVAATTNAAGVAHIVRRTDPGVTFRLKLDTSANMRIRPQEPHLEFEFGDNDEVFTWDQPLELEPEPTMRRRRRRRPPPTPIVITRIN